MGQSPETLPSLGDLFGFEPGEAALNRAGQLSPRQRQQVIYRSVGYIVRGLAVCLLNGILAAAVSPTIDRPWQRAAFVILCAFVALLGLDLLSAAYRCLFPRVHAVAGPLVRAGNLNKPCIRVGSRDLAVNARRWKRLPPDLPGQYRAYWTTGRLLLSLEPWEQNEWTSRSSL